MEEVSGVDNEGSSGVTSILMHATILSAENIDSIATATNRDGPVHNRPFLTYGEALWWL